jgi:hypothetical protein
VFEVFSLGGLLGIEKEKYIIDWLYLTRRTKYIYYEDRRFKERKGGEDKQDTNKERNHQML